MSSPGGNCFFRTDFFYESPKWADYSEWNRTKSMFRINARVGIDLTDNSTLEVFGTNLTDNKVLPNTNGTTTGPGGNRKVFTAGYPKREYGGAREGVVLILSVPAASGGRQRDVR